MTEAHEHGKYQVCDKPISKAKMSLDGVQWFEIDVKDISASGISFTSTRDYDLNQVFFLNLSLYNAFSEFNLAFEGKVVRKDAGGDATEYGLKFINVNKYYTIQLDEIIRSHVTVKEDDKDPEEDGTYEFMFAPRTKHKYPNFH